MAVDIDSVDLNRLYNSIRYEVVVHGPPFNIMLKAIRINKLRITLSWIVDEPIKLLRNRGFSLAFLWNVEQNSGYVREFSLGTHVDEPYLANRPYATRLMPSELPKFEIFWMLDNAELIDGLYGRRRLVFELIRLVIAENILDAVEYDRVVYHEKHPYRWR